MGRLPLFLLTIVVLPGVVIGEGLAFKTTAECARLFSVASEHISRQRYFDAHILSLLGEELCFSSSVTRARFRLLDAISIWKLGDVTGALERMSALARADDQKRPERMQGQFFHRWILLKENRLDLSSLGSSPLDGRFRFYVELLRTKQKPLPKGGETTYLTPDLEHDIDRFVKLGRFSPIVSGALNAVLPGAGHLYLRQPQNALLGFVLNSLAISASVEFFRKDLLAPGIASATLASIFYVGGIISGVRQAKIQNRKREEPILDLLEPRLFPELIIRR